MSLESGNSGSDVNKSGKTETDTRGLKGRFAGVCYMIMSLPTRLAMPKMKSSFYNAMYQIYTLELQCDEHPEKFGTILDSTSDVINEAEKAGNDVLILRDRLSILQEQYRLLSELRDRMNHSVGSSMAPAHNAELKILNANKFLSEFEFGVQLLRQNNFGIARMASMQIDIDRWKKHGNDTTADEKELNELKSRAFRSYTEGDSPSAQMNEFTYKNMQHLRSLRYDIWGARDEIPMILQSEFNQKFSVLKAEYGIFLIKALLAYAKDTFPFHREGYRSDSIDRNPPFNYLDRINYGDFINGISEEINSLPIPQPEFDQDIATLQLKFDTLVISEHLSGIEEIIRYYSLYDYLGNRSEWDTCLVWGPLERHPELRPGFDKDMAKLELKLKKKTAKILESPEYIAHLKQQEPTPEEEQKLLMEKKIDAAKAYLASKSK